MKFGEWISTNDRLPNKKGSYLCCVRHVYCCDDPDYNDTYMDVLSFTNNLYSVDDIVFSDRKNDSGFYDFDSEWGYCEIDRVIAWMPLPKPYKEIKE